MIKANELRIGNMIMLDEQAGEKTWHVLETREQGVIYGKSWETGTGYCKYEIVKPIPLTPEWLGACGFEKKNMLQPDFYTWWKDGMGEYLTFHHDGFCVFEFGNRRIISNLHQLQNLYFALTGEELTINNVNLQTTS